MLGIAHVGTPCTKDKQCSVNEDSGLKLGLTIAHELGHMYYFIPLSAFSVIQNILF